MPKLNDRLPKYRLHRRSGQAIVTLNQKDHYLGAHGSEASKRKYDRLLAEWLAHSRQMPAQAETQPAISINKLILGFWEHAQRYYRKADGSLTSEIHNIRQVLRILRQSYGPTSATEFGPRCLKAVREQMIQRGWCRKSINKQISRIKLVFRWAVENELMPPAVHQALLAVRGLARGRTAARESVPVRPVPEAMIAAVKPFVSRQVWALIQLQLLSGARPGELLKLRSIDLRMGDPIWTAELEEHKTAHHGHAKCIYFGPKAQEHLKEFLGNRPLDSFLFSPQEAEVERRQRLHERRRTPLSYGNQPGTNRKPSPQHSPGDQYTVNSYRHAVWRACDAAFPLPDRLQPQRVKTTRQTRWEKFCEWKARLGPVAWTEVCAWRKAYRWHPHQLRHNAGTHLRHEFGIETARVILGHRSASVTEIYAELDDEKAKQVMQKIG